MPGYCLASCGKSHCVSGEGQEDSDDYGQALNEFKSVISA